MLRAELPSRLHLWPLMAAWQPLSCRLLSSAVPGPSGKDKELAAATDSPTAASIPAPLHSVAEARSLLARLRKEQPTLLPILFSSPWTNRRYLELKRLLTAPLHLWLLHQPAPLSAPAIFDGFNQAAGQQPGSTPLPDQALAADILQDLEENRHVDSELVDAPASSSSAAGGEQPGKKGNAQQQAAQQVRVYRALAFQPPYLGTAQEHEAWLASATAESRKRFKERRSVGKLGIPKARRRGATSSFDTLAAAAGLLTGAERQEPPPVAEVREVEGRKHWRQAAYAERAAADRFLREWRQLARKKKSPV